MPILEIDQKDKGDRVLQVECAATAKARDAVFKECAITYGISVQFG